IWKEIPEDESPIGYIGNGIHVPTFLARNWLSVLDDPGWHNELLNVEYWQRIDGIPDPTFWSVRHALKSALLKNCFRQTELRCRRYGYSEPQTRCMTERLKHGEDVMVIAVARRFATYKRATLMFEDPDRLARLLNDPKRPVLLIFAGKAHPHDEPGKELIRKLHEFSSQPRFLGKVILLEGYDLALARSLVTGADLWVNVPEYPLEASGTSGMKAGINGVINLSILDGWWADGYNGRNGWALQPHASEQHGDVRRRLEAQELLDTLEHQCIPMYFDKSMGYSERWVKTAKESMKSIIPHFSAQRMVMDYLRQYYFPASEKYRRLAENAAAGAAQLARWKQDVRRHWHGVSVRRLDQAPASLKQGEKLNIRIGVRLNGLKSEDVMVECLMGESAPGKAFQVLATHRLQPVAEESGETIFEAAFTPAPSGLVAYQVRAYPHHSLLCNRFDLGFLKWV
ncbi:MAG: alpha-glucan family phosphorylase, partial [Gammaproteobacteria bacterium]